MTIKIEKNIPAPATPSRGKYAFMRQMKVGDSVLLPNSDTAQNAGSYYCGMGNYTTAKEKNGVRVWRIK